MILIGLALVKRFPYRYFYQTHRLMAVVYLVLVFHGFILLDTGFWRSPLGPVMALLMAGGTVAACVSLLRRVGLRRRAVGEVAQLVRHTDNQVLQVVIQLKDRWAGHEAGQFAFVTFDDAEGAHPFTISSSWRGDGRLVFLIKGLGDYTSKLPDTVKVRWRRWDNRKPRSAIYARNSASRGRPCTGISHRQASCDRMGKNFLPINYCISITKCDNFDSILSMEPP